MHNSFMQTLSASLRIPVRATYETGGISDQILSALHSDRDLYLDALDATLYLRTARAAPLRQTLLVGGSVWTVSDDGKSLQRRVDETAAAAFRQALAPGDSASHELTAAWTAAFGRTPNPSDAWDHAIKAVEEVLIPLVIPKVAKANLGGVAGELAASSRWQLAPTTSSSSSDDGSTLEAMLRLIWPNPDRHGGGAKRTPTQSEVEVVVHLAVALVEMGRNGRLTKKS
ncbi:hypothetical protein QL996_13330 [Planococcus sp. APC 4015]|nr:hypothetical protein [Planococcus sp. APC 4015]